MANVQSVIELRQKRAGLVKQMQDVLETAKTENRGLSVEENTKVDKIIADEEALTKEIRSLEWLEEKNSDLSGHENRGKADFQETQQKQEYRDVFKKWMTGGVGMLDTEERNMLFANKTTDSSDQRALSAITGGAGGFTVPQGFLNQLQEALKTFGGMREAAYVLNTETGNDLPIPTVNDTSNTGELVAENGAVGSQDVAFNQVTLKAYKFSSKMILVPIELLQDSAIDIEAYLAKALATRIGRITNQMFTTGTGTSQPQGVITAASVGKTGVAGQTTSVIYDDLVDLIHSVDPGYRDGANFMMNDSSLRNLKKLKDTTGAPIWVPGVAYKEPDTILGYNYTINQDMATMAANAKSIAFGNFKNYYIRNVMNLLMVRFGEKFMDQGQIGFLGFSRQDGRLVSAGTSPVAVYQNSAT